MHRKIPGVRTLKCRSAAPFVAGVKSSLNVWIVRGQGVETLDDTVVLASTAIPNAAITLAAKSTVFSFIRKLPYKNGMRI